MKKTFKRAGVAVLSMAMLLSMGAVGAMTASAAEGDAVASKSQTTLTINVGGLTSGKYKVYKVATKNNLGVWSWASSLDVDDAAIKNTSTGASFDINAGRFYGTSAYDQAGTDAQKKALASYLAQNLGTLSPINALTGTDLGSSIDLEASAGAGAHAYYLVVVTSDDTGKVVDPILQEIDTSKANASTGTEITAKSGNLPFEKKITAITQDGSVSSTGDTGIAEKLSNVTYTIKAQLPTYDSKVTASTTTLRNFVITDTPCEGLTIDTSSIKVYLSDDETLVADQSATGHDTLWAGTANYTYGVTVANPGTSSAGFTITPNKSEVIANHGKYVFVQFDAQVNANAVIGETGNPNEATLSYGNDYSTGGGNGTNEDEVTVYSARVILNKTGGTSAVVLPGAEFDLYKSDSSWTDGTKINSSALVTDAAGQIIVEGLDEGYYIFRETKAPGGYVGVADIHLHVTATKSGNEYTGVFSDGETNFAYNATAKNKNATPSNDTDDTQVNALEKTVNDPDAQALPLTGGMGTVLFTVGGAAIVLLAGALFVVYMRKRKNEE